MKNAKGFKAFNKGLICKGKQYTENTVHEEAKAEICHRGMHYCVNPFDVLDYYDLVNSDGSFNDFAPVEALDEPKTDDGKKFCTTKLKVGAKLNFAGFVKVCVDYIIEKTKLSCDECTDHDGGKSLAQIGSSGYGAKIGSSGDGAQIGSSGDGAKIDSTGENSIICCAGNRSAVKAKKGSWITLSEWIFSDEKCRWIPKSVKTEFVDGERIKEDTFYELVDGKFTEVQ